MRKQIVAALLTFFVAFAGLTILTASPAQAVTCQSSHVCLWTGAAYTGTLTRYGVSNTSGVTGCKTLLSDTMNNNAESMANGSTKFIEFYNSHNCSGTPSTWLHHSGGPTDERSSLGGLANTISSFRYCPTSSPAC